MRRKKNENRTQQNNKDPSKKMRKTILCIATGQLSMTIMIAMNGDMFYALLLPNGEYGIKRKQQSRITSAMHH